MFFHNRITSINKNDKVLEVGPGATPHPRADVFLEKIFDSDKELVAQSGHVGVLETTKPIITYRGDKFPFRDNEFDYVICTHVLEHVEDIDAFLKELIRIAPKGYLEFPTIYYEYLYNIEEHLNVLFFDGKKIRWMKKSETPIPHLNEITIFFRATQFKGYRFQKEINEAWHQGFEWEGKIETLKVDDWKKLCYNQADLKSILVQPTHQAIEKTGIKHGFNIMMKSLFKKVSGKGKLT